MAGLIQYFIGRRDQERRYQDQLQREERRWQAEQQRYEEGRDFQKIGLLQGAMKGIDIPTGKELGLTQQPSIQAGGLKPTEIRETTLPKPAGWSEVSEGLPLVQADPMAEFQKTIDELDIVRKETIDSIVKDTKEISSDLANAQNFLKINAIVDPQKSFRTKFGQDTWVNVSQLRGESQKKVAHVFGELIVAMNDPKADEMNIRSVITKLQPYLPEDNYNAIVGHAEEQFEAKKKVLRINALDNIHKGQMAEIKALSKIGKSGLVGLATGGKPSPGILNQEEMLNFQNYYNQKYQLDLLSYDTKTDKTGYQWLAAATERMNDTLEKLFQKEEKAKEFAPQAKSLVHPKTGKRKWFDMSKPEDIEAAQREGYEPYEKQTEEKAPQNFLLPNNEIVLSNDWGKTYVGADGKSRPMPPGAIKTSISDTIEGVRTYREQQKAKERLGETPAPTQKPMEPAARLGTGAWAMLAATIDNLAGGAGIDRIFGKEGLFPETQESRQALRILKQTGKIALMNSARGAVWEQQRIDELFPDPDKLWRNPRTEAKKFMKLREAFAVEKRFNDEAITKSTDPGLINRLQESNTEINRLLAMIGPPEEKGDILSSEDQKLIDKYLKKGK